MSLSDEAETATYSVQVCQCQHGHELLPQGAITFDENTKAGFPTGPDNRYCPVCVFSWVIKELGLRPMELISKPLEIPKELYEQLMGQVGGEERPSE